MRDCCLRGLTALIALSMTLSLGACGDTGGGDTGGADTAGAADTGGGTGDTGGGADTVGGDTGGGGADTVSGDTTEGDTGGDTTQADTTPACPGAAGCDCKEDKDCTDGLCAMGADGKSTCAKPCTEDKDCGDLACADASGKKYCLDTAAALCSPCSANSECAVPGSKDAACVDRGAAGSYCATACSADADCADGYACKDAKDVDGKDVKQCLPKDDKACTCSGWAKAKALSTACYADGKPGCAGKRSCGDSGLSACDAPAGKPETCSGLDEDCDGQTDNGDLCDDKNPCTKDSCGGKDGCKNEADDSATCDDGDACTEKDACKGGKCGGAAIVCNDSNPCTDDSCDKAKGCVALPNKATCDDANACTDTDTCAASLCQGVTVTCDDKDPCTDDSCDPKKGCSYLPNKAVCDDGDSCTEKDVCDKGKCAGAAKDCDDKNPCTTDVCDAKKGCQSLNNLLKCDDGDACTTGDMCKDGKCNKGNPKCVDGKICTDDKCDPKTGVCSYPAGNEGGKCDDGTACTESDACAKGKCAGKAKDCDDKNICTTDSCDPKTGCKNVADECNDDDNCTSAASKCDPVKGCQYTPNANCDNAQQGVPYGVSFKCGSKNSAAWTFSKAAQNSVWAVDKTPALPAPVSQDCALNFNNGKDYTCVGSSGISGKARSPVIDLGSAKLPAMIITYGGVWESGTYDQLIVRVFEVGKTTGTQVASLNNNSITSWKKATISLKSFVGKKVQVELHFFTTDCIVNGTSGPFIDALEIKENSCVAVGCDDGDVCTTDTCNKDTGACTSTPKAGGACDDGKPCTDKDTCDDKGKCVGAPQVGKACDDNNKCTTKDACNASGACQGTPKCDDGNVCTNDSCSSTTGYCNYSTNSSACSDGDACTGGDKCKDGICFVGKPFSCDDGDACTTDACDAKTGLCTHKAIAGCTTKCTTDKDCADGDACTMNTCDAKTGACASKPAADGTICGAAAICGKGKCAPVVPADGWAVKLSSFPNGYTYCALLKSGKVACWGDNLYYQLANGTTTDSGKPVEIKGLSDIADISVGYRHICVVTKAGGVKCWGSNSDGQIGNGNKTTAKEPVDVPGLKDVVQVSAGYNHTCALAKDQTVWCWGLNGDGQVGNGVASSTDVLKPTQVKGLGQVTKVSAGNYLTCVLRTDKSKWCFGGNVYYGVNAGEGITTADQPVPVRDQRMAKLSDLIRVYLGFCGITLDGKQHCVGANFQGAFGIGKTHGSGNKDVHESKLPGPISHLAGGYYHIASVSQGGTAWAAGDNAYGQLGDGTKDDRLTPVKMANVKDIVQVAATYYSTCALRNDGSVWCTGRNLNGALGMGTTSTANDTTWFVRVADGACQTDASCQDDNACTKQQCQLSDGMCKVTIQKDKFCDDGDKCTLNGKCDAKGACIETPKVCDDGNPCTTVEVCEGGNCKVAENADCDDGNPCTTDACDTKTGACTNTKVANCVVKCTDDAGCNDNTSCTTDKCVAGTCQWAPANDGAICGTAAACNKGSCDKIDIKGFATQISMNPYGRHLCALRPDATVSCWGYNNNGQVGDGTKTNAKTPKAVPGLKDVVDVSAGYYHSCAVLKTGKVMCWGDNGYGQLGNNSTTDSTKPVEAQGLGGIVDVEAGRYTTCARTSGGKVYCWGRNYDGEVGVPGSSTHKVPVDTGLKGVTQLSGAGYYYNCALTKTGDTWCWGYNYYSNAQATTSTADITTPQKVDKLPKAKAITTGYYTTCVVDMAGKAHCMGYNGSYGLLGIGATSPSDSDGKIYQPIGAEGLAAMAGGYYHMVTLDGAGKMMSWGRNSNGELGHGVKGPNVLKPKAIGAPSGMIQVVGGYYTTCALHKSGTVWCVGDNGYGQLGVNSTTDSALWKPVQGGKCTADADCNAGDLCFANTCDAGTGACKITPKKDAKCDDGDACSVEDKCNASGVCEAKPKDCDDGDACTLLPVCEKGTCKHTANVQCDDKNPCTTDKCDAKTGACSSTPIAGCKWTCKTDADCDDGKPCTVDKCGATSGVCEQVPGNDGAVCGVAQVCGKGACGPLTKGFFQSLADGQYSYHMCAVGTDANAYCWGRNNYGQIGTGTSSSITHVTKPVKVKGLSDVAKMAVAYYHSCALMKNGRVYCWGYNSDGQCGTGTKASAGPKEPKEVAGLTDMVDVAAGNYHSCAVKKDGTVWCWGRNSDGQIGNGVANSTDILKPVQVAGIASAVSVRCGQNSTCAQLKDGSTACWGYNYYNAIDGASTSDVVKPKQLDLPPAVDMSLGSYHVGVVTGEGTSFTRGFNNYGQCGDGGSSNVKVAKKVPAVSKGMSLAAGYYITYWLDAAGQTWAVGYNLFGALGRGNTTNSKVVDKVQGGTDIVQVTTYYRGGCMLKKDGSIWCVGYGTYGQMGNGTKTSTNSKPVKVTPPAP